MVNPWKSKSKVNPQRENGNRQLANEVYRELAKADLSGVDYKIIMHVIDVTWGYNRTSAVSPISQIMDATHLAERTVKKGIVSLKNRRIIYYQPSKTVHRGAPLNEYLFNKHYDTWIVDNPVDNLVDRAKIKGCTGVHRCTVGDRKGAQLGTERVHTRAPLKRNNKEKKESITKLSFYSINEHIEKALGKIATRSSIINTLHSIDKNDWDRVQRFLVKRYPGDGNKAYRQAVEEYEQQEVGCGR